MGMFDEVECRFPLPEGYEYAQDFVYQTKSLLCAGDYYILGADGRLYERRYNYREATDEEKADYLEKISRWYRNTDKPSQDLLDYVAKYRVRDGTCQDVLSNPHIEGNSLNFYTNYSEADGQRTWLEFNAHFKGDVIQYIEPGKRMTAQPSVTQIET